MTTIITFIPGDGIGREVIPAAQRVLEALDLPLEIRHAQAGFATFEQEGNALPDKTLLLCEQSGAVLFGATQSPMEKVAGYNSPILQLRRHFDLYANLRPARRGEIDLLIVRENTEGLYSRCERRSEDGRTAIAERIITEAASRRIVHTACEKAMERRRKLTIVHKANVLKETCGLFRETAFDVTRQFPDLTVEEMLVDSCAMRLAMSPEQFDVLVTTNMFGDILSDLAAGLTGGLGLAPSANVGVGIPVFEPVHGSAPDIAGKGTADPRAAILSLGLLLRHLGFVEQATHIADVVYQTERLGSTEQTTWAIVQALG